MSLELLGAVEIGEATGGGVLQDVFSVLHPVGKTILSAYGAGGLAQPLEQWEQQGIQSVMTPEERAAAQKRVTQQPGMPQQPLPSSGRPAPGWSQPRPDLMGPAATPSSPMAQQVPPPTGWRSWSTAKKVGVVGGAIGGTGLLAALVALIARRT